MGRGQFDAGVNGLKSYQRMFVTTGLSKCTLILKFVITKHNLLVATTHAPPPLPSPHFQSGILETGILL